MGFYNTEDYQLLYQLYVFFKYIINMS